MAVSVRRAKRRGTRFSGVDRLFPELVARTPGQPMSWHRARPHKAPFTSSAGSRGKNLLEFHPSQILSLASPPYREPIYPDRGHLLFADANQHARQFTGPVIQTRRTVGDDTSCNIGALVVVNSDGWILTAWHIIQFLDRLQKSHGEYQKLVEERKKIEADPDYSESQKRRKLRKVRLPSDLTSDWATFWGFPNCGLEDISGLPAVDLAVGRLEPFDADWVGEYPTFKDPNQGMLPGRSLCKLGFPFHNELPSLNEDKNTFEMRQPPFFPIEGIYTRNANVDEHGASFPLRFLETSTPGLRGQSGGPIFDEHGTVWAIQVKTVHFPLGFNPPVPGGEDGEVEHQFLSAGIGVHPETIVGALEDRGIDHEISAY